MTATDPTLSALLATVGADPHTDSLRQTLADYLRERLDDGVTEGRARCGTCRGGDPKANVRVDAGTGGWRWDCPDCVNGSRAVPLRPLLQSTLTRLAVKRARAGRACATCEGLKRIRIPTSYSTTYVATCGPCSGTGQPTYPDGRLMPVALLADRWPGLRFHLPGGVAA